MRYVLNGLSDIAKEVFTPKSILSQWMDSQKGKKSNVIANRIGQEFLVNVDCKLQKSRPPKPSKKDRCARCKIYCRSKSILIIVLQLLDDCVIMGHAIYIHTEQMEQ